MAQIAGDQPFCPGARRAFEQTVIVFVGRGSDALTRLHDLGHGFNLAQQAVETLPLRLELLPARHVLILGQHLRRDAKVTCRSIAICTSRAC